VEDQSIRRGDYIGTRSNDSSDREHGIAMTQMSKAPGWL